MRHSNAQTTMNIYTQVVTESLRLAMEDFEKKMSKGSRSLVGAGPRPRLVKHA